MLDKLKSLAQDTAIYGSFRIIGKMLSFLLTPIYTNYILDQAEFAFITYIFSLMAIVNVVYSLGLESSYLRYYDHNDPQASKKAFSTAYISMVITSFFFTAMILIFSKSIAVDINAMFTTFHQETLSIEKTRSLLLIATLIPFIDSLLWLPYDYLRMVRKAKKFAIVQLTLILVAVTLTIIFVVFFDMDAKGVIIAQLIATFSGLFFLRKEIFGNLILKFDPVLLRKMMIFGLPLMFANLPAMILQVFDKVIMPTLASTKDYNLYAVNYRLGIPMMMLVSMFEYAWKPFFLNNYQSDDAKPLFSRVFTYFTFISVLIFLTIGLFINFIVQLPFPGGQLIHSSFWEGLSVVPIILAGYFFNGAITNFSAGFHITKKTKYITITMWSAAIVNIALIFILTPLYSYIGTAWATFFAYLFGAIIAYYYSIKVYKINYDWKRIIILLFSALLVYIVAMWVSSSLNQLFEFIVKILLLVFYIFLLFKIKLFTISELAVVQSIFRKKTST